MKTATNGSDVCYHVFFEKVRWAVESPNIKVYICKGQVQVLMSWCLRAERLLLKDEENLVCFTRTQHDFTCFFETPDNRTYDLFYRVSGYVRWGCRCAWSRLTGRQITETVLSPRDLAGPKGVNCLCRRPKTERSSTSAHFLPWTFSCTWKRSWRLWSAATTPTCTHGPSVWKITVRNSQIQHTQHILHFTFSM